MTLLYPERSAAKSKDRYPLAKDPSASLGISEKIPFPKKSRRGRPNIIREEADMGTPELQFKRAHFETLEAFDLCLTKGLISEEQHWCGIHLRWLYTLRYGAPGLRALDPLHISGMDIKSDDPEWRASRECEYQEAIEKLRKRGVANCLMDICIHNERPPFLLPIRKNLKQRIQSLDKLREGLDILVKHWQRAPRDRINIRDLTK